MEESANDAIYIGVYVLIFIAALSLTIFLFTSVVQYAEKSYEFGQNETGSTVSNNAGTTYKVGQDQVFLTKDEVISYYYNYIAKDQYDNSAPSNIEYHVTIYYKLKSNGDIDTASYYKTGNGPNDKKASSYNDLISKIKCENNEKYTLEYVNEKNNGSSTIKYIEIKKVRGN